MNDIKLLHPCSATICEDNSEPFFSILDDGCRCTTNTADSNAHDPLVLQPRHHPTNPKAIRSQADPPIPSYIPPPKNDITPELLNQSLTVQPQNTATVGSVIPDFDLDIFRLFLQLNGIVADLLVVNASVNLACGTIGLVDPQPNVALVPKIVKDGEGAAQTLVADCQVIAVNMYTPEIITYWVQKLADGTVYSVLGSNKVLDIDKMNLGLSTAVELVVLQPGQKRDVPENVHYTSPQKRQIFAAHCGFSCPFYHMRMIQGTDGYCGCMFKGANEEFTLEARRLTEPDVHTATMSIEACTAMTCFSTGGNPAVYNPFTRTCWCVSLPAMESNPSAWNG